MPHFISLRTAIDTLHQAERVLVVGCSGGGKTTLAIRIAERFHLEYQSIDRDVRWLPDWQVRDRQEQQTILKQLVRKNRWVMDGSSPSTFDIRVPRTDLIIWVRVSRPAALAGLARRVFTNYGKVRVAMAEGCPEPIPDRDFLSYIWNFERDSAPKFIDQIDKHGPEVPVIVIKSRSDGTQLLNQEQTLV
jgi:adenylate kinase family enzyme